MAEIHQKDLENAQLRRRIASLKEKHQRDLSSAKEEGIRLGRLSMKRFYDKLVRSNAFAFEMKYRIDRLTF